MNVTRPRDMSSRRLARLTASAFAVAAVVAGMAAIRPDEAGAAPQRASARHDAEFKAPKLKHGLLKVKGTDANDEIVLRLKAGDASILEVDAGSALFRFDRADIERIEVDGKDGNDGLRIDESNGAFTNAIPTELDGGDGNDTMAGGSGAETFRGGDGNDSMDGNRGNDLAYMGDGDDTFIWDPGDGNDTIEGQDGTDTMRFNGANGAEQVDMSANGERLRFFRQPGNVLMDTDDVEQVDFNALGGADSVNVNDLSGTDVRAVNLELAGTLGGTAGDGAADPITVSGTNGNDAITISGDANAVNVSGLSALVSIRHAEPADSLIVNAQGGNDSIDAAGLPAGVIGLTIDAGAGNDTVAGSQGAELVRGGDGNDTVDGNRGNDTGLMGAGDDTFIWDPGDGNDTIEGQDGTDTMRFNGANGAEQVDVSANGKRLRFFRQPGNVLMDTNDLERVDFNALGGSDVITVNSLAGTDVTAVNLDLAGTLGGNAGDGAADQVIVNATDGDDTIDVSGSAAAGLRVSGLAATVAILHPEASDRLDVNTQLGNDTVGSAGLAAGSIQLFVDGLARP